MATYKQIQEYVHEHYGYTPKTCWIADVKEQVGIPMRRAPNRVGVERVEPCPTERVPHIEEALQHFDMLKANQKLLKDLEQARQEVANTPSYPAPYLQRVLDQGTSQERNVVRESAPTYGAPLLSSVGEEVGWKATPTASFRKSMKLYDKTLLGRMFEAVVELCDDPTTARGDTVKPLTGDFAGYWRYRVGDYRLIYTVDERRRTVNLLKIAPRGSAYTD
jgi:addiction module RelE/StbE family toxin